MLIAQISDCHIVDPGSLFADRIDSAAGLRAAVETINDLELAPDLVLATGDLVNDGTSAQYDHLQELLADLRAPFVPMPGNHDDRTELRRRFPAVLRDGAADEPLDFTLDLGPVRLVCLDTTIPGRHDGHLTASQLDWLDHELSSAPERPTIVAQHHPPVSSGVIWMDERCGFQGGDNEAAVLGRHPQVEAVVSGHLHRAFHSRYAGTVAVTCPSTACQLALGLATEATRYSAEPTGFALHHWRADVGLTSHIVPTGMFDTWAPSWAG
jgi:3',5'-cyclic AMP phosphodiesterase CpdA